MDSGTSAALKRSVLEVRGQLLLIWADTMTLLLAGDVALLRVGRVVMITQSGAHKNVHVTGCQPSECLTQSSLGPRNEEGFSRLCLGKHLNNPGDPWEENL